MRASALYNGAVSQSEECEYEQVDSVHGIFTSRRRRGE